MLRENVYYNTREVWWLDKLRFLFVSLKLIHVICWMLFLYSLHYLCSFIIYWVNSWVNGPFVTNDFLWVCSPMGFAAYWLKCSWRMRKQCISIESKVSLIQFLIGIPSYLIYTLKAISCKPKVIIICSLVLLMFLCDCWFIWTTYCFFFFFAFSGYFLVASNLWSLYKMLIGRWEYCILGA